MLKSELGLTLPRPKPVSVPLSELQQLEGTWSQPLARYQIAALAGGLDIIIESLDRDGSVTETTSPVHFEPIGDADFVVRRGRHKGMRADFLRNPDSGMFEYLRVGLRVARRQ